MNRLIKYCLNCRLPSRMSSSTKYNQRQYSEKVESQGKSFEGLLRCDANDVALTPISFLERSAKVFRDRTSIVYGSVTYTWEHTYFRCLKLASALIHLGISQQDVVRILCLLFNLFLSTFFLITCLSLAFYMFFFVDYMMLLSWVWWVDSLFSIVIVQFGTSGFQPG